MSSKNEDLAKYTGPGSMNIAVDAFALTLPYVSDGTSTKPSLRGLRADTTCTVTLTTLVGETRALKFTEGETRYLAITGVASTTAGTLEGLV